VSLFAPVFCALLTALGCTESVDVADRIVLCVDQVCTSSWQAFPLKDAVHPSAKSTAWGKQTFLIADKFVGSAGVGGPRKLALFKREFKGKADRELFADNMKKQHALSVGFLSLTVDAPVIDRGIFATVTQRIWYKLVGVDGHVWTAGSVCEKVTGRRRSEDVLVAEAVDSAVAALVRQLSLKMQP